MGRKSVGSEISGWAGICVGACGICYEGWSEEGGFGNSFAGKYGMSEGARSETRDALCPIGK